MGKAGQYHRREYYRRSAHTAERVVKSAIVIASFWFDGSLVYWDIKEALDLRGVQVHRLSRDREREQEWHSSR